MPGTRTPHGTAVPVTEIGRIVAGAPEIQWLEEGVPRALALQGWDHFKEKP